MVDEEQIDNMSYIFFEEVLAQLGRKLSYDAIVNYAGNSFVEKSWDMIMDANPMYAGDGNHLSSKQRNDMAAFFGAARVAKKDGSDIPKPPKKG